MTTPSGNTKPLARTIVAALFILAAFISGCDRTGIYEKNLDIPEKGWNSDDFLRFTFPVSDTAIPYNLFINVRNSTSYPYSNLYLFIRTYLPDTTSASDTLDLVLAGPDGKWLGKGIGKYRDNQVLIMSSFRFPQKGTYSFEIEHAMRESDLKELDAVGMRVEKSGRKKP